MSFAPADFPGFGGLNLAADSEDSPGALDLSNVTLSQPGPSRLMPRPGYTLAGTTDLSAMNAAVPAQGTSIALGGAGKLYLMSIGGSVVASNTGLTASSNPWSLVPYGYPGGTLPAFTNPTLASNVTGWAGTNSTATRDTSIVDADVASVRWDNTGASDVVDSGDLLAGTTSGTWIAGVTYTITFRCKASASPAFGLWAYMNFDSAQKLTFTPTTSWATYTLAVTPTATVSAPSIYFLAGLGAPLAYFNFDAFTIDTPGALYATNTKQLVRYDQSGTAFETFTVGTKEAGATSYTYGRTAPIPNTLAVQPKDNRLVACGFTNATDGPRGLQHVAVTGDGVFFSQPDAPELWDETDYVMLAPGDGEEIRAACPWNDYVLVFKQSKFFVFYGNSRDSTGGSVFNYRTVQNAFGGNFNAIYQGQVCSAPSGVYVITDTGVWKTTGGAPALVSGALSPLFHHNVSTLAYAGTGYSRITPRSPGGTGGSFWHQGKVFFSVTLTRGSATTSSGWLILDEQSGQWVVWELADTPRVGVSFATATASDLIAAVEFPSGVSTTGRKGLLIMDGTATTDNGTAIASYYTAPYLTYGEPKAEKHVRSSELHGTGTVTLAWGSDLQTHGTAETVAMSSGVGHARTGARGRTLSFKIAASAAGWTVNRVVPMLQSVRSGR